MRRFYRPRIVHYSNSLSPAILSFQIENDKLLTKTDEFIVSYSQYKGVSPYRGKNDAEKMVDISFQVDIYWLTNLYRQKWYKTIKNYIKNGPFYSFIYRFNCFKCHFLYRLYWASINRFFSRSKRYGPFINFRSLIWSLVMCLRWVNIFFAGGNHISLRGNVAGPSQRFKLFDEFAHQVKTFGNCIGTICKLIGLPERT